jgi:hypothetical protein
MADPREIAEEILTRPGRYRSDSIALARAFLAQQPVIDAARRVAATYNEDDLSYLGDTLHRLDAAAAPPEAT